MANEPIEAPLEVRRAQRRSRSWGAASAASLLVLVGVLVYIMASNQDQDVKLNTLASVINKQNDLYGQVCRLAGGQVDTDPAAREACARVQRGEPAVPIPVVITGAPGRDGQAGASGIGIATTRQIDQCFIEVVLTNGSSSRFGSFCGPAGPTGVSGEPGPSGTPGEPGKAGRDGVGIATARTAANPCFVEVVLTDGTVQTVGPFCGPPVGEFTMSDEDGAVKRCLRDGGSDNAPNYSCRTIAGPPSSSSTAATTSSPTATGLPLPLNPTP